MHTLIHRALSPQTISYAWLVLTVALTFALAVAQSAIAAGPSLSAAGLPVPHVALAGPTPAPAPDAARAAPRPRPRPGGPAPPRGRQRACRALGASAGPPVAGAGILAPSTPRRGADALAALYGGAGPHGPPASAGFQTNVPVVARLLATDLDLDFSLSLAPLGCLRAFRARRRGLRLAHARHRDAGMSRTPSHRPVADCPRAARRRVATSRRSATRAARGHACPVRRPHRTVVVPRG